MWTWAFELLSIACDRSVIWKLLTNSAGPMALREHNPQARLDKISIPKITRKKFAKPPVKVACLSWWVGRAILFLSRTPICLWNIRPLDHNTIFKSLFERSMHDSPWLTQFKFSRASRTRCDGKEICSSVCICATTDWVLRHVDGDDYSPVLQQGQAMFLLTKQTGRSPKEEDNVASSSVDRDPG